MPQGCTLHSTYCTYRHTSIHTHFGTHSPVFVQRCHAFLPRGGLGEAIRIRQLRLRIHQDLTRLDDLVLTRAHGVRTAIGSYGKLRKGGRGFCTRSVGIVLHVPWVCMYVHTGSIVTKGLLPAPLPEIVCVDSPIRLRHPARGLLGSAMHQSRHTPASGPALLTRPTSALGPVTRRKRNDRALIQYTKNRLLNPPPLPCPLQPARASQPALSLMIPVAWAGGPLHYHLHLHLHHN